MAEAAKTLTVNEISGLLKKRYERYMSDIKEYRDYKPKHDPDSPDWEIDYNAPDGYQIANNVLYLKEYYKNQSKWYLWRIISEVGKHICTTLTPIGIKYLREQGIESELLDLQERILATPHEVWVKALEDSKELFKEVERAPEWIDYRQIREFFPEDYIYYKSLLLVNGTEEKIMKAVQEPLKKRLERQLEDARGFGVYYGLPATIGGTLYMIDHWEKNLDTYIDIDYDTKTTCTLHKEDDHYIMRFFIHRASLLDRTPQKPKKAVEEWFNKFHKQFKPSNIKQEIESESKIDKNEIKERKERLPIK